jgi:hypothetical protein
MFVCHRGDAGLPQALQCCKIACAPKLFLLRVSGDSGDGARPTDQPQSLATNVPGVFGVGDVRAGSVKRWAAPSARGRSALTWNSAVTDRSSIRNVLKFIGAEFLGNPS